MKAREVIRCRGHPLIRGTHPTTFEVTKDREVTLSGDCIIGVAADKGAADLSPGFRRALADDRARLITRITVGDESVEIRSRGSGALSLDHPTDLVWRQSTFVCGRTVGISSDRVARTLPRTMIERLRRGEGMTVELIAVTPGEDG
ncbi:MAG: DUF371 domain-containing protein [Methanomicrobiaceae archaeon]|nr:DUF371 domain-containing protein [Methanomicrobiaceae archaeon]MDD5420440.1 DUF371 domain-containing protein [Methanomicrobiaceae archaeon]